MRQVLQIGDLNMFERFLRLVAARTGQIINFSDLARDVGISPPTARTWLSVLEASGQVYLLPPYHNNFGKRLIKSPKIYWLDTAMAAFLIGLHSPAPLRQGPFIGPLLETAIVAEWIKTFLNRGLPPPLYFWRSRDGLEVDLLIEHEGRLRPIEVKAAATINPHHADALVRWHGLVGKRAEPGVVVADVTQPTGITKGVSATPWWW